MQISRRRWRPAELEGPLWTRPWVECSADGCRGSAVVEGECVAHVGARLERTELDTLLQKLLAAGLDARGVRIPPPLVAAIQRALREQGEKVKLERARFDQAIFTNDISFENVALRAVCFDRSVFERGVSFAHATFKDEVSFHRATFGTTASFEASNFESRCTFEEAVFVATKHGFEKAEFRHTRFGGKAIFDWTIFERNARFDDAVFAKASSFAGAIFEYDASFERTQFQGDSSFNPDIVLRGVCDPRPAFASEARFRRARFEAEAAISGCSTPSATLIFDEAAFASRIEWNLCLRQLSCRGTRFREGASIRVRYARPAAEIVLDGAEFGRPSIVSGTEKLDTVEELALRGRSDEAPPESGEKPRLLSLARANVADLLLSGLDLLSCRFIHAHNLDKLRTDERADYPVTPSGWRFSSHAWPPLWRWSRRQTVAEEHFWRWERAKRGGWRYDPSLLANAPSASDVAAVYRALRKGREDAKNEPGAADFYYGEMEMRRHGAGADWGEWTLITLYWAVSGYGLRTLRALAFWVGLVCLFAFAFGAVGFEASTATGEGSATDSASPESPSGFGLVVFAAETATGLLRPPEAPLLSTEGRVLQIALRVIGPVLLGLALLAVRGRAKR